MALTENSSNPGQNSVPQTNNLLDFMSNASSSIQEAMVPKQKRPVNVRKYIQRRVKRLSDKGTKPVNSALTKNKPVLKPSIKPDSAKQLQAVGSYSWPSLTATPDSLTSQTQNFAAMNYPSHCSPPAYYPYDQETSLYQPTTTNKGFYAELDFIDRVLSELESEPSTRHNSDSIPPGPSPGYPATTLESQVVLAEHPFSPHSSSDCSDDIFDHDSAYSSPIGSVDYTRSTVCSPPLPATEWHAQSPPTTQCPVTSTVWYQEQTPVSTTEWLPNQFTSFDQAPQTVSELYF